MSHRTRWIAALLGATSLTLSVAPTASAAQTVTNSFKCTVTAIPPVLVGTMVTTMASVVCTKSATITIDIKAVEMESSAEQSNVVMAENKALSVSVVANVAKTISTTGTCINTETGFEEYATKVRVGIGSKYSNFDRTAPASNSYNC